MSFWTESHSKSYGLREEACYKTKMFDINKQAYFQQLELVKSCAPCEICGLSNSVADKDIKDNVLGDTGDSWTINFQIGPVPAVLEYGYGISAGVRIGTQLSANLTTGFTAGFMAGPYLVASGFMACGVGIEYGIISASIGIEGKLNFFDIYAPLKAQILLRPEIANGIPELNFYVLSSLIPEVKMLSGSLGVYAKGSIGKGPFSVSFKASKEIVKFDPLIDMNFGNVIPMPAVQVNLLSLKQVMNSMNKK